MPKTTAFELDILELIFTNTTLSGIGDTTGLVGSGTAGSVYIALAKGDPGEAGDLSTQEVALSEYGQYARQAVARSGSGWDTDGSNGLDNAAAITFPQMTSGTGVTVSHFAICKAGTRGTNDALYYGSLTASLAVSSGITPEFAAGDLDVTEE